MNSNISTIVGKNSIKLSRISWAPISTSTTSPEIKIMKSIKLFEIKPNFKISPSIVGSPTNPHKNPNSMISITPSITSPNKISSSNRTYNCRKKCGNSKMIINYSNINANCGKKQKIILKPMPRKILILKRWSMVPQIRSFWRSFYSKLISSSLINSITVSSRRDTRKKNSIWRN